MCKLSIKKKKKKTGLVNAGERPAEDRRNALYMRAQQNSAAARLTMHFGVAAGLTAVIYWHRKSLLNHEHDYLFLLIIILF